MSPVPVLRRASARTRAWIAIAIALCSGAVLGFGCMTTVAPNSNYDYFTTPDPHDAWSQKITGWQIREQADRGAAVAEAPAEPTASESGLVAVASEPIDHLTPDQELRTKYREFRASRRRALVRDVTDWIQSEARNHYVADGPIDHWATLEETLRENGDDCDGLELLVFNALRDLGIAESDVYRAIVYRPSDGQHHMVTLWFETQEDPWVIDPTGAMITGLRRMSQVPDWVPLKVFTDTDDFTVRVEDVPALSDLAHR